jgi:hypothetical protein
MEPREAVLIGAGLEAVLEAKELQAELSSLSIKARLYPSITTLDSSQGSGPIIINLSSCPPSPDPAGLKALVELASKAGAEILVFNCIAAHLPTWEQLLRRARTITTPSHADAFALLDRFIGCVELPGDSDEPADRIHLSLLASSIQRQFRERPSVSVVIPLYNTPPDYLRETIRSVLDQDDPDWELVLVDNGDPGVTGPVVRKFSDPRIRYFEGLGNRGIAMGRNLGNMLARGRIIAVMDHDDLCAPDRVSAIKKVLGERKAILYSDIIQLFPDGSREWKKLKSFSMQKLRRDCYIYHPSVAYPWELARDIPYDPRFEPSDDYKFYLAALRRKTDFIHENRPLLLYRRHPGQYSETAQARLQAVAVGARAEDQHLRAGGDPLDRAERFEKLVLALFAFGCDDEAEKLLEAGYGPEKLKRAMAGKDESGKDSTSPDGERVKGMIQALLDESAPAKVRQGVWLMLRRRGPGEATEAIEAGLDRGRLGPMDRSDLAGLLIRMGETDRAGRQLDLALQQGEHLCLAAFLRFLLELWKARLGPEGDKPPTIRSGPGERVVSVIITIEAGDRSSLHRTLESLAAQEAPLEIIIAGQGIDESFFTGRFSGLNHKIISPKSDLPGAGWNQGLEAAGGSHVGFLRPGDAWDPGFPGSALQILNQNPDSDAILGQVEAPGGVKLPGRTIGVSPILRDERALVCGCVFKRKCFERIGGFIPGLEQACSWELMIRAMTDLSIIQPDLFAGTSSHGPLLGFKGEVDINLFRQAHELNLLVKYLHQPLRYLDYRFSGVPPEWIDQRFSELDRITLRHDELIPFLDPWEYLSETNTSYHLLYRLARNLEAQGLFKPARFALLESIQMRPFEPKLWTRLALLSFRSLLVS